MSYLVSKLFTYLFLPPGVFIFSFFILMFKDFKKLAFFMGVLFYFFSTSYGAYYLLNPLEEPYKYKSTKKADEVVVLGGGKLDESSSFYLKGDAFIRLMQGILIAKEKNIPLIYTGGGIDKFKEAMAAKKDINLFEKVFDFKIKLYLEDKSLNTYQNGLFTKQLIQKNHLSNKIYLVTSAYHMKRSEIIFKSLGFDVVPIATDFKLNKPKDSIYDFLPQMGNFYKSYLAIHEYIGIAYFKLKEFIK